MLLLLADTVGTFGTDVPDVVGVFGGSDDDDDDGAVEADFAVAFGAVDEGTVLLGDPPGGVFLSLFLLPALPNKLLFCADNDIEIYRCRNG